MTLLSDAAGAAAEVLHDRSDTMLAAALILGFVLFVFWRDSKETERRAATEEQQSKFQKEITTKNASQLDVLASSMERVSKSNEITARAMELTERHLDVLTTFLKGEVPNSPSLFDSQELRAEFFKRKGSDG